MNKEQEKERKRIEIYWYGFFFFFGASHGAQMGMHFKYPVAYEIATLIVSTFCIIKAIIKGYKLKRSEEDGKREDKEENESSGV